ncbi:MAG: OsmC family protein [Chloroflexota bacterium]
MPVRKGEAIWRGDLRQGHGTVRLGSGLYEGPYSYPSRFEEGEGTNPEELIAAAHAGCYAMALSNLLSSDGYTPRSVYALAQVHLGRVDGRSTITRIDLECEGDVPGIDAATFSDYAERAKTGCPVSKALAAVEITLKATLKP